MITTLGGIFGILCVGVLLLGFGGGGAFLIYQYFNLRKKNEVSQTWPSITGQVVSVNVERSYHSDSEGDSYYTYEPRVTYTYHLGGIEYTGKNLTFGFRESQRNQAKAQAAAARYTPGQQVTVIYNPDKPEEAALERRTSGTSASLIIGIALLAVAACMCCPLVYLVYNQVVVLSGAF